MTIWYINFKKIDVKFVEINMFSVLNQNKLLKSRKKIARIHSRSEFDFENEYCLLFFISLTKIGHKYKIEIIFFPT